LDFVTQNPSIGMVRPC